MEVSEDDGFIRTNRVDVVKKDGVVVIDNVEILED